MRLMVFLAACLVMATLPADARELPVWRDVSATAPSGDCPDCVGASVGAGAYIPNCFDCPAVGARVGALHADGSPGAAARVCYSSFFYFCFVDVQV